MTLRKVNSIVTMGIMVLFLVHMIWGILILTGMTKGGSNVFSVFSYMLMVLIAVHVLIGIKLTIDTIIAAKKSHVFYWRENSLFLLRRISGFALLLFILAHVIVLKGKSVNGSFRLPFFDEMALASQILMVLSLLVHLATNIKPLKIALGFSDKHNLRTDIGLVLAILLFLSGIAFVIYFIRWQVI